MKGFVNVERGDLQSAIAGFEKKLEAGKAIRDKGIKLFYEKHYTNGGRFTKYWNRNKSQSDFVRSRIEAFGTWSDVLHEVLTREEIDHLDWWCWTSKSEMDPLRALVRSARFGRDILIDDKMAVVINKYKGVLGCVQ